jgi:trimethylamine--corrinoid protein Co-methyltransferase
MVTNMSAASLEQAVIDDEVAGMVLRVLRGVEVTDPTLAVEAIARVGPGGHYLMDDHTLQFMRSELYHPSLADRQNRVSWETAGKQDTRTRAAAQVEKLLRAHQPPGMPVGVEKAIRSKYHIE